MKKLSYTLLFVLAATISVSAQIYKPVKWQTSVEKVAEGEYDLIITAVIEPKWHLYAQNVPEDGPVPTTFYFEEGDGLSLVGETTEDEGKTVDDPVFGMRIKYFEDLAVFKQRVKADAGSSLVAEVEFMVCDDTKCLPPTYADLTFNL